MAKAKTKRQAPPELKQIPLSKIVLGSNVRPSIDEEKLKKLKKSLIEYGQLQPVLVEPMKGKDTYKLIFGHRRFAAATEAGWDSLDCMIKYFDPEDIASTDPVIKQLVENIQRDDLSPIAEAKSYKHMQKKLGLNQSQIARLVGVTPSHINHRLAVLEKGSKKILDMVDKDKLSVSKAEAIVQIEDEDEQDKIASTAAKWGWNVSKVEEQVKTVKQSIVKVDEVAQAEAEKPASALIDPNKAIKDLDKLDVREDLSKADVSRAAVFALLRNGQDYQILEQLEAEHKVDYDHLWDYVSALDNTEVEETLKLLVTRFLSSAHRYPTLSEDIKKYYGRQE